MTDSLTIRTNNAPRPILQWSDLSEKERREFDYLDTEQRQQEATFFRYKGNVYDLGEFMRCPDSEQSNPQMRAAGFHTWDGYHSDSFFSGILVRYTDEWCESVVVGDYFS